MEDNKSEEKHKKKAKHTTKIVYHRWIVCGGRKEKKTCLSLQEKKNYTESAMINKITEIIKILM